MIAQDARPAWRKGDNFKPFVYTQARANLITTMLTERGIPASDMLAVFPHRPSTREEFQAVMDWIKDQKMVSREPSLPSSAQVTLPENVDKNGKARPTYYAIDFEGQLRFFRVKAGYRPGTYYVDEQASDELYPVRSVNRRAGILTVIAKDPASAMQAYGSQIGRCGRCHRTLTDPVSRQLGIGPDCRSK